MSISTTSTTPKPEDKRDKLKKLREFHQPTLNTLGVNDTAFIPKFAYPPHGKTEKYVAFFQSEISKGQDIFVEFCDKDNNPQFEDRALYRWKFNPRFEEEYEKTEPSPTTGHIRYLVSISEFLKVKDYTDDSSQDDPSQLKEFELADPDVDLPMDQMTIRDYAAIHMKKPVSMKPWLNEIISKSL